MRSWRVLLIDGQGRARWGQPAELADPPGRPERATVQDASGTRIEEVDVYRTAIADSDASMVLVPAPRSGWRRVQVAGATTLEFR
jgi:hypothetical protein